MDTEITVLVAQSLRMLYGLDYYNIVSDYTNAQFALVSISTPPLFIPPQIDESPIPLFGALPNPLYVVTPPSPLTYTVL